MSQIGARTPINSALGYQEIYGGTASGWQRLGDILTIPPEATGALIFALDYPGTAVHWAQSPNAVLGSFANGLVLAPGQVLVLEDATQVQGFCVYSDLVPAITVQFFTGPRGRLPSVSSAGGSGGGGGGGVVNVTGTSPIQSTGGTTPDISIEMGLDGDLLQYSGPLMQWRRSTGLKSSFLFVDNENGYPEGLAERNNPHRPFKHILPAQKAAQDGDTIIVLNYPYFDNDPNPPPIADRVLGKNGVNWWLCTPFKYRWDDKGTPVTYWIDGPGSILDKGFQDTSDFKIEHPETFITVRCRVDPDSGSGDSPGYGTHVKGGKLIYTNIVSPRQKLVRVDGGTVHYYAPIIDVNSQGIAEVNGGELFIERGLSSRGGVYIIANAGSVRVKGRVEAAIFVDKSSKVILEPGTIIIPEKSIRPLSLELATGTIAADVICYGAWAQQPIEVGINIIGEPYTIAAWVE